MREAKVAKHTPGPWKVQEGENAVRVSGGKDDGFGTTLVSFAGSSRRKAQDLINARLIAVRAAIAKAEGK